MNPEDPELKRLLEAYFDGTLGADDLARLEARLAGDPDARQAYWEMARWHAALSTWGSQQPGKQAASPTQESFPGSPSTGEAGARVHAFPRWAVVALAAAACVALIWVVAGKAVFGPRGERGPIAELVFTRGAQWADGAPLSATAMQRGHYRLERGVVTFNTTAGAVVSVAAPADFTFTAADHLELATGRMTARMLRHGTSHLIVDVHGTEVRDLGTAFGIDAREAGRALVSVFDGLVAVTGVNRDRSHVLVAAGHSVVASQNPERGVEPTAYATEAFDDLWPLTVGINEASQLVRYLPPGPLLRPLREYQADRQIFLFPERQAAVPAHPVPLDISPAAPEWPNSPVTPYPMPGGRRVNSYLVFYQPTSVAVGAPPQHLTGQIVFRHRVLGIICSDQWLGATDAALGYAGAEYSTPHQHRGLEEADKDNYRGTLLHHDSVSIAPDGHTVHFDFYVSDEREELRIIVAAE